MNELPINDPRLPGSSVADIGGLQKARSAESLAYGGDGPIINDPVLDGWEDHQEPIVQVDPKLATLPGQPWFDHAVDQISEAAAVITEFGLTDVVVCAGAGRLVIGNPVESALAEVGQLPAEGLAFVVLKASDVRALPMRAAHDLSERIRAANPNAHLLVLPEDWSFRTMKPEMAHQFASNMLVFCDDKVLAALGLKRVEAEPA